MGVSMKGSASATRPPTPRALVVLLPLPAEEVDAHAERGEGEQLPGERGHRHDLASAADRRPSSRYISSMAWRLRFQVLFAKPANMRDVPRKFLFRSAAAICDTSELGYTLRTRSSAAFTAPVCASSGGVPAFSASRRASVYFEVQLMVVT
jgi:hypothetical protein